ncbi:DNA-binding response regulator [Levilactobacillus zymae]|nr:DNA-binding response regulator [Levilactobacillus zymae]
MMHRILVADSLEIVCTGLTYLVDQQPQFQVVAQTHNGTDTFMRVEQGDVDVVIMGLNMPGENALLTIQRLHELAPQVAILILTVHEEQDCIVRCLQSGAGAYVLKRSPNYQIVKALKALTRHEKYIDPNIMLQPQSIARLNHQDFQAQVTGYDTLSKREREIFPLITLGYGNKEIAQRLCISTKTVEAHKANIMRKLALDCHVDLVHYAVHHHLVNL